MKKVLTLTAVFAFMFFSAVIPARAQQTITVDGVAISAASSFGNGDPDNNGSFPVNSITSGNTINFINGSSITGGSGYTLGGSMCNGCSGGSSSNDNTVNITDSTASVKVCGAYLAASYANSYVNNNTVNITGSTINQDIFGGWNRNNTGNGTASGNTVNIMDSTITKDIYGGYVVSATSGNGTATDNTITIGGASSNLSAANLYGSYFENTGSGTAIDLWTGNTLNVEFSVVGNTVAGIYNFENINFYLPDTMVDGETMLNVTAATDITGSKIGVAIQGGGAGALNVDDQITLINAVGGLTADQDGAMAQGIAGISKIYDFELSVDANNLYATVLESSGGGAGTDNEQTKALSEGQLGGLAFLNQGSDLISGSGISSAMAAAGNAEGMTGFAAMGGGSAKYKTGSHIDVKGFSVLAGLAKRIDEAITAAAFLEAGWGNYDSFNSFNSAADVNGDGSTNYYGLGFLGRYDINEAWYSEGSLRIGSTKTDFSGNFDILGKVSYDTSAMYTGAHLGGGYLHKLNEEFGLDFSARLFYTWQGGDDVTIAGDKVEFDPAGSIRTRIGGRVNYEVKKNLTPYGGLFLDYEFAGKAKAKINGAGIDTPELKGATGVGELGVSVIPAEDLPLTLDIGLQGYAGTREGFSASLQARYLF